MRAKDALEAYFQWKLLRKVQQIKGCIQHTDGGSQYFSTIYLNELKKVKFKLAEQNMFGEWICRTMEWFTKESFYTYNQVPK